jgi:hypothetical protein
MRSLFLRLLIASVAAASLAACSNAGTVPGVAQQNLERTPTRDATKGSTSLCNLPRMWHFNGSCKAFAMKKAGTTVALDQYRGLTVTITWPGDHPPQNDNKFVTSVATGDGDITGKFKGRKFPAYGSIPCEDPYFRKTSCPGEAFLYNFFENSSSFEIGWDNTPKFTIENSGSFSSQVPELL